MSRTVAILLLVVAVVAINAMPQGGPNKDCGPNEVFDTCGSDCEPSCARQAPTVCTLSCKIGCRCLEGYVRNGAGQCVLTRDC